MKTDSRKILLSPFFLFGLSLLLLNDFYLKAEFHNFFTGKISDFAGLFVFPLFFAAFFPKRKSAIYLSTGILFVFWKSPFSQFLIEFWNSLEIFRLNRVIDVSDLSALLILPVSYKFFSLKYKTSFNISEPFFLNRFASLTVILISVFAFTATSYENERTVWINNKYEFEMNLERFETLVKNTESFNVLKFENVIETFPAGNYSNSKSDSKQYIIYFDLNKGYCESKNLRIFVSFEVTNKISIDSSIIAFECQNPPSDEDKQNLISIFERDVIGKLRQNSSQ